jgi:hypothetical protein
MTRAPMRPLGYDPETIAPSNVPSFAEKWPLTRTVFLSHPAGNYHPSILEAVRRYTRRGWEVVCVRWQTATDAMQEAA